MTQSVLDGVLDGLLAAAIGGVFGIAIGLWIERWMGPGRYRPVDQYGCPHGFAIMRDCPTCAHFNKIRVADGGWDAIQRERE